MRITDVEPIVLRGSTAYGEHRSDGEVSDSGDWQTLVRVSTDEGLIGWSDIETLAPAAAAIIHGPGMSIRGFTALRDLLIGKDPLDTERLWDELYVGSVYYGRRGIAMHCISAIDNCLWSIRAQSAGKPLCDLLGGRNRDRIRAYASTLFRDTPDQMAQAARSYIERGFTAVKFGWGAFGRDPGLDVELVAAARDALGPDRDLLVDPGWYSSDENNPLPPRGVAENIALCERMAAFGVGWIEDFIHPEHFDEYTQVRRASSVPIAAGEQMSTIWDFQRLIDGGCVDVVQPDLTRCGGITVARQVADMANRAQLDLVPHSWLTDLLTGYSLHLIASLPTARYVEFNVAQSDLTRGVCGGTIKLNDDGTVNIPTGTGLGIEVDADFIKAHCTR